MFWIGKSKGTEIIFNIENSDDTFTVFTTRADTLFGCTYCCLAPEHPLVKKLVTNEQKHEIRKDTVIHQNPIKPDENKNKMDCTHNKGAKQR